MIFFFMMRLVIYKVKKKSIGNYAFAIHVAATKLLFLVQMRQRQKNKNVNTRSSYNIPSRTSNTSLPFPYSI